MNKMSYLLTGISLFLSTQFKYTFMLALSTCDNTEIIDPTFWAPLETGSTITFISKTGSSSLLAFNFITLYSYKNKKHVNNQPIDT